MSGPSDESGSRSARPGYTLEEVAEIVAGEVVGDPGRVVESVAPLEEAGSRHLGFLAHPRYLPHLAATRAGALLVARQLVDDLPESAPPSVVADDAHMALARLLTVLHTPAEPAPRIHPTAVLGTGVRLGEDVHIGPYAVVEEGSRIGDRVRIGAHSVVGTGCRVGSDSVLHPHVVLYPRSELGERVILHAGVRVGVDGFGYVFDEAEGEHRKIPQVGRCVVEDDVEIGAGTCLDRGSIGTTRVGQGSKLDNLIHLGHNVEVGPGSVLVAQVGVSGSTRLGKGVQVGGQAGFAGHSEIGAEARIGGQAGVIGDVAPGETVSGYPARNHRDYLRGMALVMKLPQLVKRIRALEESVGD